MSKPADDDAAVSDLQDLGFDFELSGQPRITMGIQAFENGGKTALACSSGLLGNTAYMGFDPGYETTKKYQARGFKVGVKRYSTGLASDVDTSIPEAVSDVMGPRLEEFESNLDKILEVGCANVIIDDATTFYDFVRLATIGKLSAKAFDDRGAAKGQVNAKMRAILYRVEGSGANLILIEKLSEFQDKIYTKGWDDLKYFCPFIVRADYGYEDPDTTDATNSEGEKRRHRVTILKSKFRPELQGMRIPWGEWDGFPMLCGLMHPQFKVPAGVKIPKIAGPEPEVEGAPEPATKKPARKLGLGRK